MADSKISALTAAVTPLAGTEILPIVQSGATTKVSVANLTAGRAVSASSVTTTGSIAAGNVTGAYGKLSSVNSTYSGTFAALALSIFDGTYNPRTIINYTTTIGLPAKLSFNSAYSSGWGPTTYEFDNDVSIANGNLVIGTSGKGIDFSATPGTGTSELLADYEEGTWTATFTGWTVAPTVTKSTYTKVGRQVTVSMLLNGGTVGAGTAIGGLPFTINSNSICPAICLTGSGYNLMYGASGTTDIYWNATPTTAGFYQFQMTYFV